MPKSVRIFDFDQTLSYRHTFSEHRIERYDNVSADDLYQKGKENAATNSKTGLSEWLKHDKKHLSAIASYHNNPAFIAGFIAGILGKKLTLTARFVTTKEPDVSIHAYTVEGEADPILISSIRATGREFNRKLKTLTGKNNQINFLRQILLEKQMIVEPSIISYFDDSEDNVHLAKDLPFIKGHLIDGNNTAFTVLNTFDAEYKSSEEQQDSAEKLPETKEAPTLGEIDQAHQPISSGFFLQLMSNSPTKFIGGLLLIAGLAALTIGVAGIIGGFAGVAVASGAIAALGTGLLAYGMFSTRTMTKEKELIAAPQTMAYQ